MRYPADFAGPAIRSSASRAVAAGLVLLFALGAVAGCGGPKVIVPIKTMDLPARASDAPVDIYWSQKSVESWFKLATDPKKAPDLQAARLHDTHKIWENRDEGLAGAKVADLEVEGNVSGKNPREWLLVNLGASARRLGADAVIVNSVRVVSSAGNVMRETNESMWSDGVTVKVWLYAQAVHYE